MLAISSGGDHSAYVLGMLKGVFLHNPELTDWSTLAGISAGALLGTKISQVKKNDYASFIKTIDHMMHSHVQVCKQWSSMGKVVSFFKAFMWHDSVFKSSIIDLVRPEWSETRHRNLYVGAYNETQGMYETFGPSPTIEQVSASASVPVVFSPVKMNGDVYCDGAMRHVIPVPEIKKYWTSGSLDLMLCYPTSYEAYKKTSNSPSKFKIVDEAWNTITRSQWVNYNNDLDEMAELVGADIRNGGIFNVQGKTLRVYVPKEGIYCDFIHRDMNRLSCMHEHGEQVARELLS